MEPLSPVEEHPLQPFLPPNSRILFLGSFPPPRHRWCMEFYYPNMQNDFWRIAGILFFGDKERFVHPLTHKFDKEAIVSFLQEKGIALYDTACAVRRLKGNASDEFLETVTITPLEKLLPAIPLCHDVCVTGGKALDNIILITGAQPPAIGEYTHFTMNSREYRLWRMPSSSRAYPLPIDKKAAFYHPMLTTAGIL